MKFQLKLLQTALLFYTRIPVGKIKDYKDEYGNYCACYLPLIGLLVGALSAFVFYIFSNFIPQNSSLILSMLFSVIITGAFHEDGLADFCDGFGGGFNKERIMLIMKDSRLGSYALLGLLFAILLKYSLLMSFDITNTCWVLIASHSASRVMPLFLMHSSDYVQHSDRSKLRQKSIRLSSKSLGIACFFAIIPILLLGWQIYLLFALVVGLVFSVFRYYVIQRIGGYTGDVLGALQQLSELLFYLCSVCLLNA